ncbi:DUF3137 domain-containing protein [Natronospora cellulosivora (SeqCode)]
MNIIKEIQTEETNKILDKLNKERLKIRKIIILFTIITIILLSVLLILMSDIAQESSEATLGLVFIAFCIITSITLPIERKINRSYLYNFKIDLIPQIVKSVDKSLKYEYYNRVSEKVFRDSYLYESRLKKRIFYEFRYKGYDLISGNFNDTKIILSQIEAKFKSLGQIYEKKMCPHAEVRRIRDTVFTGIFFVATFKKQFNTMLFIKDIDDLKLAKIYNKDFECERIEINGKEKHNDLFIYANNQVEAKKILRDEFMEKILKLILIEDNKRSISISLIDTKLYIGISMPDYNNLFKAKIFSEEIIPEEKISIYYKYLSYLYEIVDTFKIQ